MFGGERPDGLTAARDAAAVAALVIDDHPLFCEALAGALRDGLGLETVEIAGTLGEGLSRLTGRSMIDVVALDLNLPDVTGLDGLGRLKAAAPATPVVVVSALTDDRIIASSLRAGAAGFVRKDTPAAELAAAFRRVLDGEVVAPPGFAAPADGADDAAQVDEAVKRLSTLTPQQLRILALVCEGRLNKQIAFELDIAETTVKAHITAILRKLGVHSRTQAVLAAQKARYDGILNG